MKVSVMMAPKTSKSQVGADFCCGWGNCHICDFTDLETATLRCSQPRSCIDLLVSPMYTPALVFLATITDVAVGISCLVEYCFLLLVVSGVLQAVQTDSYIGLLLQQLYGKMKCVLVFLTILQDPTA
jgi:hypothetical protein